MTRCKSAFTCFRPPVAGPRPTIFVLKGCTMASLLRACFHCLPMHASEKNGSFLILSRSYGVFNGFVAFCPPGRRVGHTPTHTDSTIIVWGWASRLMLDFRVREATYLPLWLATTSAPRIELAVCWLPPFTRHTGSKRRSGAPSLTRGAPPLAARTRLTAIFIRGGESPDSCGFLLRRARVYSRHTPTAVEEPGGRRRRRVRPCAA